MKEKVYIWIAWHLPKELLKWCYVKVAANATYIHSDKTPYEITIIQALEAW